MCGRYFIDGDTGNEISSLIGFRGRWCDTEGRRDICPAQKAWVLCRAEFAKELDRKADGERRMEKEAKIDASPVRIGCVSVKWGFPGYDGASLVINARRENVFERKMFRDRIYQERCVIPAKGFYEWNRSKEKSEFYSETDDVLFLAGILGEFRGEWRFVILTAEANASVAPVHDRMPMTISRENVCDWICNDRHVERYIGQSQPMLKQEKEYEQLSFF